MQAFNFALRQSTAESVDDNRSRYVPSSIYSGPGPAEEAPPAQPAHAQHAVNGVNGVRNTYQESRPSTFSVAFNNNARLRKSSLLNASDPVMMHLLTETALGDSKEFEVLSFEELEHLKRARTSLRNGIETKKRKLALEGKLRDAAQSLNRLYTSSKGSVDLNGNGHQRNLTGSKNSIDLALSKADDEYQASNRRIEQLAHEIKSMEVRLDETQRRILEHTAGILQFTHRGLKKNLKKNELPRSPESMASHGHRSISGPDAIDDFDERSLYPVPDYAHDFTFSTPITPVLPTHRKMNGDSRGLDEVARHLNDLSMRMHDMVRQFNPTEELARPPGSDEAGAVGKADNKVQANLEYLSDSLEALADAQQRTLAESESVNARINKMLERTDAVRKSPLIDQSEPRGEGLASQLAFSTRVLEQLQGRIETLVEQKDILTRQIQQQRDLNSKSDAQRDAQIRDLTEELEETKRMQTMAEEESQQSQNQIELLIEQLDRSREDVVLMQQQQGMNDSNALQAERDARKASEREMLGDIEAKQQINAQLQADMSKMQNDFELRSQQHIQQVNELTSAKEQSSLESQRYQTGSEKMLEQLANLQTELTIVKAELDGAYGTRAQRAADVSLNPAIQKEIDTLNSRNGQLQKELKDTIEDYEQMTKASIEFEKERENFESTIDTLREKCESLESQISEERLKWLGVKAQAPSETTSTMVLKNEFKKMMRDTRTENLKVLRVSSFPTKPSVDCTNRLQAEQEERRRLEQIIRNMRKEAGLATPVKPNLGSNLSVEPITPSAS